MLHITNGDSVSIEGHCVPWRDILHDGPVPRTGSLHELSAIRARFLAEEGYGSYDSLLNSFRERDASLHHEGEVVLWFEHDLYDQLQLIQILDWFHKHARPVSLIQSDTYLGPMPQRQVMALLPTRRPVTAAQFDAASRAWLAFTSPDPAALPALDRLEALPYLRPALQRLLEEYPSPFNGLSRSQNQILRAAGAGYRSRPSLYRAFSRREDPVWLGDDPVFKRLESLMPAAITHAFEVTAFGRQLLLGRARLVTPRWIGGVEIKANDSSRAVPTLPPA